MALVIWLLSYGAIVNGDIKIGFEDDLYKKTIKNLEKQK